MKKVSIIVPFTFGTPRWELYLERCLTSIAAQTFQDQDYEVILLNYGKAAETQNRLIKMAQGELIKILHADDCFTYPSALEQIVDNFKKEDVWQASGCVHSENFGEPKYPHKAKYSADIHTGNNTIGAPSVLTFRNGLDCVFDEDLNWLYDVSLYKKLYDKYGAPSILDEYPITIGLHPHQLTHRVSAEQRQRETELMAKRYAY